MTTIKITDLNGAKEAFPRSAINNVYRITHHDITNVHLEVDVEAVGKAIDKTMPCNCIPAYKDRGLSAPDCPNCNYKEDLVDLFVKLTGARLVRK